MKKQALFQTRKRAFLTITGSLFYLVSGMVKFSL